MVRPFVCSACRIVQTLAAGGLLLAGCATTPANPFAETIVTLPRDHRVAWQQVETPAAEESGKFLPPMTSPAAPAPAAVCAACPDFWIVGSRHLRSTPRGCDASCQLAYFYGPSTGGLMPTQRDAFLASLRPDRPVCFVIHGSYNWWHDIVAESRRVANWVQLAAAGRPVQIVMFTWPSEGYMPFIFPVDLAILGRRSANHGFYIANLISHFPADQPVCLIGHSHGARAAVATLHLLGGGSVDNGATLPLGAPVPKRLRAVLLAAGIDHDSLNPRGRYGKALLPVERLLVIRNADDGWLTTYPWRAGLPGPPAMGKTGLKTEDRLELGDLGYKVVQLDATQFIGISHGFKAYNTNAAMAAAITPYVTFHDEAAQPTAATPGAGGRPSIQHARPAGASQAAPPADRFNLAPGGQTGSQTPSLQAPAPTGSRSAPAPAVIKSRRPRVEMWVEP